MPDVPLSSMFNWGGVGAAMPESYGANAPITDPLAKSVMGLMTLPQRAMDSARQFTETGQYDPAPIVEAAMLPMGTGAIAGVPLRSGEAVLGVGPIRRLQSSGSLVAPPAPTASDLARAGRIESVPLAQARSTQSKMSWDDFEKGKHPGALIEGYENLPVAVRREDGEYLIFDGHHRTVNAMNDGLQNLDMHVINAKDYAPEYAGRAPAASSGPKWTAEDEALLRELMGK